VEDGGEKWSNRRSIASVKEAVAGKVNCFNVLVVCMGQGVGAGRAGMEVNHRDNHPGRRIQRESFFQWKRRARG
jgi:hypothetical protein